MNKPKRPSTLKKPAKIDNILELPSFQSRRTLAHHVQDNMQCAGKQSYHQRIIFVVRHKIDNVVDIQLQHLNVKRTISPVLVQINKKVDQEKITGLCLIYNTHSVYMLEGPEENLAKALQSIIGCTQNLFDESRVVLVYNNINQRYFNIIVYKFAEPSILIDKTPSDIDRQTNTIIKRIVNICVQLKADNASALTTSTLHNDYKKLLPEAALIDSVLKTNQLQTVSEFANQFGQIPEFFHYNEHVWPIPYDFVPNNVFDWGKYDINLTFNR